MGMYSMYVTPTLSSNKTFIIQTNTEKDFPKGEKEKTWQIKKYYC